MIDDKYLASLASLVKTYVSVEALACAHRGYPVRHSDSIRSVIPI